MRFFKRKKVDAPVADKVAGKIAGAIILFQSKLSRRMNRMKHLKIFLILCCLSFAGMSIYFIVDAVVSKPVRPVRVERINIPVHVNNRDAETMNNQLDVSVYERIQNYKKYMDSIGEAIRPSLADSIKMIEEMYLSQQK